MSEVLKFYDEYPHNMNAEQTLVLGKAMLRAAFSSPLGSTQEGEGLLTEAFRLGKRSLEIQSVVNIEN